MDFDRGRLDVTYYEGTSLVTLRQPGRAQPILDHSLAVQGQGHVKAHSILQLALAATYLQQGEVERACEVAVQALDLPSDQRIGPIDQRARGPAARAGAVACHCSRHDPPGGTAGHPMSTADLPRARMQLGQLGVWTYQLSYQPAARVREVVAELEELGYGALWIGDGVYREPLTHAGFLLASTRRMVIATGIANVWARDPFTMAAAQLTLSEAYPDRFLPLAARQPDASALQSNPSGHIRRSSSRQPRPEKARSRGLPASLHHVESEVGGARCLDRACPP
jgi:Luciferase-like monooxygenase